MNNITKGCIDDIMNASKEKMRLTLLKKDFSGQIIKGAVINDSMIAKCIFTNASIYVTKFVNCDFVCCDFSSCDLYNVSFNNCRLNECSFKMAKFENVSFDEECKLNGCLFSKMDLKDAGSITGVNPEDLHIVNESSEPIPSLLKLGFTMDENGFYTFNSTNYPDTFVYVYYDTETEIYRLTCYVQGTAIFTYDLDDIDEYSIDTLKRIITNSIKTSVRKINETNDEQSTIRINSMLNDFLQNDNLN